MGSVRLRVGVPVVVPLELDEPAQRVGRGGRLEFEAAPRLARERPGADLHEARVRAAADVLPLVRARVEVLHEEAHVHPVARVPVAGHRAADPDRVGVVGRVAEVDRRPQFGWTWLRRRRERPRGSGRSEQRAAAPAAHASAAARSALHRATCMHLTIAPRAAATDARGVCYPLRDVRSELSGNRGAAGARPDLLDAGGEDLERIAQLAVPRAFDAGQVVFREGDASDTCYVVHTGRARAVHQHGDGRIITLATFGPGDIFGELALFEDELRSATVEALEATRSWPCSARHAPADERAPADRYAPRDRARPAAARDQRAPRAALLPERAEPRRRGPQRARRAGAGARALATSDVQITATQTDLAKLAGSSRESASRFLAVLERAGVISQGRGRLVVHDPDALRSYVF